MNFILRFQECYRRLGLLGDRTDRQTGREGKETIDVTGDVADNR